MYIKYTAFFLILILSAYGCKENSITESDNQKLVVEAFLYAGEKVENIRLTKTLPLGSEDTLAPPVSDAQVILYKNGVAYTLSPNPHSGGYYIYNGSDLSVEPGSSFSIEVNYQGNTVSGSTIVPQKPQNVSISSSTLKITQPSAGTWGGNPFQDTNSIYIKWDNPDSSLYYVVIENLETSPTYINNFGGGLDGAGRRMTFPPSPTREFVISRRNLTYYGKHKAVVYRVNQEYADLYESRNQDSRNLNEPLTNIKNGLGVFSAFSSMEVYFEVVSQ